MDNIYNGRFRVCKSPKFEKILQATEENNTLPSDEIWRRFVIPLDPDINISSYKSWKRAWNKQKQQAVQTVVQGALQQGVEDEMTKQAFFNQVDKLAGEKLNDPEERSKLNLKDSLSLKMDTERLKQKDRELDLKSNEDDRAESKFEMMVHGVMSGKVISDEDIDKQLDDPRQEGITTETSPQELNQGQE